MRIRAVLLVAFAVGALVVGPAAPAWAAEAKPLVVTLDKAQIVRLVQPARRVIVGNPAIADVTLETPGLMYVFGKVPGETNLIILGDDDREVFSRPVVVTTNPQRAVSVHVPAADGPVRRDYSCLPERCLRLSSPQAGSGGLGTSPSPSAGSAPMAPGGSPASPAPDILQPGPAGTAPPFN